MSDLMNKWERKYGKFAIKNLTLYMIIMYIAGFVMELVAGDFLYKYLTLDIYKILHGEVWRLVSWLFMPPGQLGIFTIFMLLLYYWLGNTLERQWGAFRYNLFIFSGIFFTILGAFVVYLILILKVGKVEGADALVSQLSLYAAMGYNTYFINTSIFLAFASIFPDVRLYLYFIIPVKIKWLAAIDIALLVYLFIRGTLVSRVNIIASILNVVIYILISRKGLSSGGAFRAHNQKQSNYAKMFKKATQSNENKQGTPIHKHKCFICGRTELTNPELEFRFCSKCKGAYEYCNDHLFTHVHKQ